MGLDYASASIIGTAISVLICRTVVALQKNQVIKDALRQHHKPRPSKLSQGWERMCAMGAKVPPSVRVGLVGVGCSIAPWLIPTALQMEGRFASAAGMAGKCKPDSRLEYCGVV